LSEAIREKSQITLNCIIDENIREFGGERKRGAREGEIAREGERGVGGGDCERGREGERMRVCERDENRQTIKSFQMLERKIGKITLKK